MIAAAYIRVSTEDQIEFSPDSQLKKIKEYAAHNDMNLLDDFIFSDEGISGRKAEKRPAFMQMIGLAKRKPKPFDVILVWKYSRFARNREDSIVYKSMLRKQCGIDVVSVSEQIGEDKTSILIEALLEAMDEYYSINLAEEVKRGMTEKFSRGGVVSIPSFGYKMKDGIYVPDEEKAPIVKKIYEDFLNGVGARAIAVQLNAVGIRSNRGNAFENRTIEYILTNPVYIGKCRRCLTGKAEHGRFYECSDVTIIDGKHEPIIDVELFNAVQKKIDYIRSTTVKYTRAEPASYMLKGLVRCSNCGATLVMSVKQMYLQCYRYTHGQCPTSHAILIKTVNEAVLNQLQVDLNDANFTFEVKRDIPKQDNSQEKELKREYKKLERVKEAFESGIDTIDEYKVNKTRIQSRIAELEKKITVHAPTKEEATLKLKLSMADVIEKLKDDNFSANEKNVFLKSIIHHIIYDKKTSTIQIFYKMPL